jgi:hypothetical protein
MGRTRMRRPGRARVQRMGAAGGQCLRAREGGGEAPGRGGGRRDGIASTRERSPGRCFLTQAAVTTTLPSSSLATVPAAPHGAPRATGQSPRRARPGPLLLRWPAGCRAPGRASLWQRGDGPAVHAGAGQCRERGGKPEAAAVGGRVVAGVRGRAGGLGRCAGGGGRLTAAAAGGLGRDKEGDDHRCRAVRSRSGAARRKGGPPGQWGWLGTWQDEEGPGDGAEEEAVHEAAPAHVGNEADGRHPAGGGGRRSGLWRGVATAGGGWTKVIPSVMGVWCARRCVET